MISQNSIQSINIFVFSSSLLIYHLSLLSMRDICLKKCFLLHHLLISSRRGSIGERNEKIFHNVRYRRVKKHNHSRSVSPLNSHILFHFSLPLLHAASSFFPRTHFVWFFLSVSLSRFFFSLHAMTLLLFVGQREKKMPLLH